MLFIANVDLRITRYMQDDAEMLTVLHTVTAETWDEVYDKIQKYYEDKNESYDVHYWVNNITFAEHIE